MDLMDEFPFVDDLAAWEASARQAELDYTSVAHWVELEGRDARERHYFQFLVYPDRCEPTITDRWDFMAQRIRAEFGNAPRANYGLEFVPADERAQPRQRTLLDIQRLTGHMMTSIYEAMLHSQDQLYLEGFIVKIGVMGGNMVRRDLGGSGGKRAHGFKAVPARLKGLGLGCHPLQDRHEDQTRLEGYCGTRALLLARQGERYFSKKGTYRWPGELALFPNLLDDAEALARQIGMEGGRMELKHLENLLALDDWHAYRVVVFNFAKKVTLNQAGEDWTWLADQDRRQPDPHTLHVFLDVWGDGHYWWIEFPQQFLTKDTSNVYRPCFACFEHMHTDEIPRHECKLVGSTIYQCTICRLIFTSQEGLEYHKSHREALPLPCEACGMHVFNGIDCWESHLRNNCVKGLPQGVEWILCQGSCGRKHRSDLEHDCLDWGECDNCARPYQGRQDVSTHRCCIQPMEVFWDPLTVKAGKDGEPVPTRLETHWAYDFETNKAKRLGPEAFRHAVMAWNLLLMVLDEEHRELMDRFQLLQHTAQRLEPLHASHGIQIGILKEHGRLLIRGKSLESFVAVVEEGLVLKTPSITFRPVLWAHNGSKFDVKFVMDYYLNEVRLDLAGDKYQEDYGKRRLPTKDSEGVVWKKQTFSRRKDVVRISNVGSKILCMKVRGATYRCSHAHHAAPLRDLPAIFGLQDTGGKGDFPYSVLDPDHWGLTWNGLPALACYEVDKMNGTRRLEVATWWTAEQMRSNVSRDVITAELEEAGVTQEEVKFPADYGPTGEVVLWDFDRELWKYLYQDVMVLARSMEAYHLKARELHRELWEKRPDRRGKWVSPLSCATSPGFALRMYRTWFMPANTLYILKNTEADFVRGALRGGRTDKRANYVDVPRNSPRFLKGDKIVYVDFVSLYPSVQKCSVHDTHFPVGPPREGWWRCETNNADLKRRMQGQTGFLKVTTRCLKYVTHPTLHRKAALGDQKEEKLVFDNLDHEAEVYAWPELLEAMDSGEVEVEFVDRVLLFDVGHNVFDDYVDFFYKLKDSAGKEGNAGLKSLAKLLLNSLWGKLGQRSYSLREWVVDKVRLDYLFRKFERKELVLKRFVDREGDRCWFEYENPTDVSNLNNTAVHIAAFVSTWGRVMLHKKVLRQHGQRVLYSDTDSAIVYLRGDAEDAALLEGYLGDDLGQLQNEVQSILKKGGVKGFRQERIAEAVFVAPKTYALRIEYLDNVDAVPKAFEKVVCKGFEPSFANRASLNYHNFKDLVWTQFDLKDYVKGKRMLREDEEEMGSCKFLKDSGRLGFRSSLATNEITPVQVKVVKTLKGAYTKGELHTYDRRLIKPFGMDCGRETFLDFVDAKQYS